MSEHHEGPIKTPKQLIITVLLAFLVPVLLMIMLSQWVTGDKKITKENEQAVAERIKPVGSLVLAGPKIVLTGEQVYNMVCTACHGSGLAGAPKTGDKTVWAKLLKAGKEQLTKTAISGIRGMPPRGGNPELSDQEVEAAVVFIANQAGANWQAGSISTGKGAMLPKGGNPALTDANVKAAVDYLVSTAK